MAIGLDNSNLIFILEFNAYVALVVLCSTIIGESFLSYLSLFLNI